MIDDKNYKSFIIKQRFHFEKYIFLRKKSIDFNFIYFCFNINYFHIIWIKMMIANFKQISFIKLKMLNKKFRCQGIILFF